MSNIVYGNSVRLFVNTALGCDAKCSYCYLDFLELRDQVEYYEPDVVLKMILSNPNFRPGRLGTVISLGCYSESWSKRNKASTFKIIKEIAKYGNYIQMSTKKQIEFEEAKKINECLISQKQLQINISVPTISCAEKIEPGTDEVEKRLSILDCQANLKNIEFMLYIKPVLHQVTICDLPHYVEIVNTHGVNVIVGDVLNQDEFLGKPAEVGEGKLFEHEVSEGTILKNALSRYTKVYSHSTEPITLMQNAMKK